MNDKLNPRQWLRDWLLKPSRTGSVRTNAVAQGEPEAMACSLPTPTHQELCPAWVGACDALSVSDNALAFRITSIHRRSEVC